MDRLDRIIVRAKEGKYALDDFDWVLYEADRLRGELVVIEAECRKVLTGPHDSVLDCVRNVVQVAMSESDNSTKLVAALAAKEEALRLLQVLEKKVRAYISHRDQAAADITDPKWHIDSLFLMREIEEALSIPTPAHEAMGEQCKCRPDWFCDKCHNEAMEDIYGSHGQG